MDFRRMRAPGASLVVGALAAAAAFPMLASERAARENTSRLQLLGTRLAEIGGRGARFDSGLSLRASRLDGLLASWETIGGCGAGSSTGAGGGIKWIGRSATGGLFQLQSLATYTRLLDGYNLSLSSQISRDLSEKWNLGLSVPVLYKYYRDYYGLPVDVSNGGVGDVAASVTRRFGEINNTSLTLLVGFPTGAHDAKYKNDYLTQEKQLGLGKVTGAATLDHTIDETWGLIVLGGSFAYRGGENELGNFRAPAATAYSYGGYFLGPFVPSLGLGFTRYFGIDRDRGLEQTVQLMAVTGTFAIEWSNDSIAILAGVSLPYGWESKGSVAGGQNSNQGPGLQPWTAGLGFTISPF